MFFRPRVDPDFATLPNMGGAAQFAQAHRRCQEIATLADVVSSLFLLDLQQLLLYFEPHHINLLNEPPTTGQRAM